MTGSNFGRLIDSSQWTDDERAIYMGVDDIPISGATRAQIGSLAVIDGTIPLITVGKHNLTIGVAGQNTTLFSSDAVSYCNFAEPSFLMVSR